MPNENQASRQDRDPGTYLALHYAWSFFIHVGKAILACKCKGYFNNYHKAINAIASSKAAIALLWQAGKHTDAPATPPADSTPAAPRKKEQSKEATTQEEVVEDKAALDDDVSLMSNTTQQKAIVPTGGNAAKELEQACLDKKAAQDKHNLSAGQFFTFYVNLLSKDAWCQLDKVVSSQLNTAPWTNVRGKDQPKACVKLHLPFMDCVFAEDSV